MRHRVEKRGQCVVVSGLQLLDEILHVLTNKLLCGRSLRFSLAEAVLLTILLVVPLLAVDALLLLLLL
jgi:hypothetical protein